MRYINKGKEKFCYERPVVVVRGKHRGHWSYPSNYDESEDSYSIMIPVHIKRKKNSSYTVTYDPTDGSYRYVRIMAENLIYLDDFHKEDWNFELANY